MKCYGHYRHSQQCEQCEIQKYCQEGGELAILGDKPPRKCDGAALEAGFSSRASLQNELTRYSVADLIEVVRFMASLDASILRIVRDKLDDPSLNLSELAEKRGVTRQAVHKLLKHNIAKLPELSSLITYRRRKPLATPRGTNKPSNGAAAKLQRELDDVEHDYLLSTINYVNNKRRLKAAIKQGGDNVL